MGIKNYLQEKRRMFYVKHALTQLSKRVKIAFFATINTNCNGSKKVNA